MTSPLLATPILGRELTRFCRTRATYLVRAGFLLVLVGIVTLIWAEEAHGTPSLRELSELGRTLYGGFFGTLLGLAILVFPILLGGALADETANRTLETLLTTPIGRWGIVWSKFVSRMCYGVLLLTASFPVMVGCLYFGGVAPDEVAVAAALVLGVACWVSALTLAFSALVRRAFVATLMTYFAVLGWSIGAMVAWALSLALGGGMNSWFVVASPPFYLMYHLMGETPRICDPSWGLIRELAFLGGTSTLFLALAARCVGRRIGRAAAAGAAAQGPRSVAIRILGAAGRLALVAACAALVLGLVAALLPAHYWEGFAAAWPPFLVCLGVLSWALARIVLGIFFRGRSYQPVWENPFLWKEVRLESTAVGLTAARGAAGAAAAFGLLLLFDADVTRRPQPPFALECFLFSIAYLVVSVAGGSSIASEREEGMLDLLIVTPAAVRRLFDAKLWGALSQLSPIALFLFLYGGSWLGLGVFARPGDFLVGFALHGAALYFQAALACALSLRLGRSTPAILCAIAFPLVVYALWPIGVAIACEGLDAVDDRFVAMQPNPFFLFGELALGSAGYPIDPRLAALLDVLGFLALGAAIQVLCWKRFHSWARSTTKA